MSERETVDEIIADEEIWSNGSVILYHVTPERNVKSIELCGIDPTRAAGRMTASWYVSRGGVLWSLAHCSVRHRIAVNNLCVCTVMLPRSAVKRTSLPFMFYVRKCYQIATVTPAEFFISPKGNENE